MDVIDEFEAEFGNPNKLDFFARKCEICSVGMNFGWLIESGGSCCSEKCCRKYVGDEVWDEAMFEWKHYGDSDILYHTHWEDLVNACYGDDGYYNSKGDLIECSEDGIKKILSKSEYFSYLNKEDI